MADGQGHLDFARPFAVEGLDVRGRMVRLGPSLDRILSAHAYPEPVSRLLAEALMLVSEIAAGLKFDGKVSLQVRGEGPVSMLIADITAAGLLRGYARLEDDVPNDPKYLTAFGTARLKPLTGGGALALIIDQGPHTERYQTVVNLEGETLRQAAEAYFQQSEQIATALEHRVSKFIPAEGDRQAGSGGGEHWVAAGLMLQHLPGSAKAPGTGEPAAEAWNRSVTLLRTVEDHELLDPALGDDRLLYRLFHEDGVRVFDRIRLDAGCNCDPSRIQSVLENYGAEDLQDMVEEGAIRVTCEFCRRLYLFDPDTLALISNN